MNYDENSYSALLERIYSLTPSVQTAGFTTDAYKPGLAGMEAFDRRLGQPWKRYRCVHVAGTNGKGSVASMIASALATGSTRVGLYTSPHLTDFRERMKIISEDAWAMPSKREVWEFFTEHDTAGLSFFEQTTGLALWWFARQGVDWAVVETGLGGRLDSTNIIRPELSVITSIGLDHCAILGSTRAEIAAEKAGIFKAGVPALVASEDAETAPVFREIAERTGSPLLFADGEASGVDEAEVLGRMDLQGPCQRENLHTVLIALWLLDGGAGRAGAPLASLTPRTGPFEKSSASGLPSAEPYAVGTMLEAIERTAGRTGLRGRWERLSERPEVICDIAHNPPALELNFQRLRSLRRPLIIIYGIMADKDLAGIAPLMPPEARYILAAPAIPRALPADRLRARLSELRPGLQTRTAESVAEAIGQALAEAAPDSLIYIGGSTFVVSEAVEYFNELHHD